MACDCTGLQTATKWSHFATKIGENATEFYIWSRMCDQYICRVFPAFKIARRPPPANCVPPPARAMDIAQHSAKFQLC